MFEEIKQVVTSPRTFAILCLISLSAISLVKVRVFSPAVIPETRAARSGEMLRKAVPAAPPSSSPRPAEKAAEEVGCRGVPAATWYGLWRNYPALPRALTRHQHWKMMQLMRVVDDLLQLQGNISYIMYGGTLLGSIFFHDIIPWDDDMDILAPQRDKEKLLEFLRQYGEPEYNIINYRQFSKIYHASSPRAGGYKWRWPFLDIGYYLENATHIWEVERPNDPTRTFPRSAVFPFHRRPLAGGWFNAPRDPFAFMRIMLSARSQAGATAPPPPEFECRRGGWDHRREKSVSRGNATECSHILEYYPAVVSSRRRGGGSAGGRPGVWETLTLNTTTLLHQCYVEEPSYAEHGPLAFPESPGAG